MNRPAKGHFQYVVKVRLPAEGTHLKALLATAAALIVLHLIGLAAGSSLLRLDSEGNIPTWVQASVFLVAGCACFLAASQRGRARRGWLLLGLVLTAFSLDEVARLHERLETRGGAIVMLGVEPILALTVTGIIWSALRSLARPALWLLGAAVASVLCAELASLVNEELGATGAGEQVLAVAEEIFELLTGGLVLTAALRALQPEEEQA